MCVCVCVRTAGGRGCRNQVTCEIRSLSTRGSEVNLKTGVTSKRQEGNNQFEAFNEQPLIVFFQQYYPSELNITGED